ncbi:type IV secretory system conjugative DNA transfer family protein [Clostridium tagluense]|uniref:hypothetical protein n=1 Tax=Clostridium tagluense TaxID=360422 RepID=UPI001CF1D2CC|nr:hypothetical protein [Clostridium tagluense]MCB2297829.1 hypothetical protein [Clostridium tagluense]
MFSKKDICIPISKYLQLIKPQYVYLQITPHKSTRNYNSSNIAKAIQHTYKAINKRVKIEQNKLRIETNFKISYVIDIRKINTSFYFIVPKVFLNIIIEKIREIWSQVSLDIVDKIEGFGADTVYYQLNYKKEDALSLQVDKKSNEPLNSILAVMEIMQEEDRVTLVYNFLPKSQFGWDKKYNDTRKKINDMKVVDKDRTTIQYKAKAALSFLNYVFSSIVTVINDFAGDTKEVNTVLSELLITSNILEVNKRLSDATITKKDKTVLDAQILIATNSVDMIRKENNAQVVVQAFRVIDENNELISKRVKLNEKETINIEDYKFKRVGENTFSVDEMQNFIQQPGRQLMKTLGIKHTEVNEVKVPQQLDHGYINLGKVKCQGNTQDAYIEDKYDTGSLPLVEIGSQGAGKTTFMSGYYKCANVKKEGGVIIDFIKNCEMSDDVIKSLPTEDMIILDYTKAANIQAFAFNEFKISDDMDTFEKLELTNKQAQQILTFVDSINAEQPLQARMRKYLSAAANVVFASGENSLKEVVKCLECYEVRASYIKLLNEEEFKFLEDEIKSLQDLDEYSKASAKEPLQYIIGTKMDRIDGILDRISLLREDFKLKYMFNKNSSNNIDFAEELEKGKTIIIRMPQDKFNIHSKNIIVTFLLSKVWIATELRGKLNKQPKPTHICVDEIFQTRTAMKMLANHEILPQTRKFGCKFVLSCQYTDQIDCLIDTLEGAGSSFMLMGGTSEKDFKRFENKLENFEYEDLRDMPQYSSLNLIHYSKGYSSFISKLPPPIK